MGKLVAPHTYLIGYTTIDRDELNRYLWDTGNEDFLVAIVNARQQGISEGEILCSFYAKLCYASLSLGKNKNVSKVRDIHDNLVACFEQGHGSVFEHCQLNFVTTNCSRVLTHELVRHRVGTAFSQTSGRYVRGDEVNIVFDPILSPVKDLVQELQALIEGKYQEMVKEMKLDEMKDFGLKKKVTSALRRVLPNGQSNEIGWSVNLRALRHLVQLRTSRHAEWEIRTVFQEVYHLTREKFPLLYHGAKEEIVDGIVEVSGLKMQPYDKVEG